MSNARTFTAEQLRQSIEEIFVNAGLTKEQAGPAAGVILAGERDNCKSHGVYRIEGCLRTLAAGKVKPDAVPALTDDGAGIVRVDADGGFSPAAFALGAPVLAERAEKLGIAALVINNCTHFSALWPEIEALTERGLAAMAMCPSYSSVAPSGGNAPLLGTNPFAFGWPRPDAPPYVFDFATSVVARGEIELHRQAGKPLPEGWAVDRDGNPTTDPAAALEGAMLPFGAHKGSAISTMIELLAGAMIGDLTSDEALDYLGTTAILPHHGELVIAFSPRRFAAGRPGDPFRRAEAFLDAIAGQGARLPSQRRFAARRKTAQDGITLTGDEVAMMQRLRDNPGEIKA
ncbi:Ldh family oxidoreductase [Paracoccus albus]|uniref:Ldh family oxidoreductase n=1 Tax=Paracoccus albus TaxID=3017784 RepID=UPI0022F0FC52|nr:Ldh family oxidoreductase [Paracoccus albus]WBU62066.1 Ldh family oxidoreductase [Paracoccus albus]